MAYLDLQLVLILHQHLDLTGRLVALNLIEENFQLCLETVVLEY